jgi:hypothetical protein
MRLELSEAISLILALPSHRSNNDGHRAMGTKAIEYLLEYKEVGKTDEEKSYNRAMIASVFSAVRAFSVERDRISGVWTSINQIKKRRERYLDVVRSLSLLEKGNYWSRSVSLLIAIGFSVSVPDSVTNYIETVRYGVIILICLIIGLEIVSKVFEISLSVAFEKWLPIEKSKTWQNESMVRYKELIGKFIDEAILNFKKYFPNEENLYCFDITKDDQVKKLKEHLIETKFYF